jgi:hypothetical protein
LVNVLGVLRLFLHHAFHVAVGVHTEGHAHQCAPIPFVGERINSIGQQRPRRSGFAAGFGEGHTGLASTAQPHLAGPPGGALLIEKRPSPLPLTANVQIQVAAVRIPAGRKLL